VVISDEVRFYYAGVSYTHGYAEPKHSPNRYSGFGLATLPAGRYAGWQAGAHQGRLTTQMLRFGGRELHLNLDASRGETRLALLDQNGVQLPGFGFGDCTPLTADSLDCIVRWKGGDLPAARGPIRLAFTLRQSALYTWQSR
jgi:hypothetical protein